MNGRFLLHFQKRASFSPVDFGRKEREESAADEEKVGEGEYITVSVTIGHFLQE